MDAFSYGLVCFWLLFEPYLAGKKTLPADTAWAKSWLVKDPVDIDRGTLKPIKIDGQDESRESFVEADHADRNDHLPRLAHQFFVAESKLCLETPDTLSLFCNCLVADPEVRETDVKKLVRYLDPSW
jgi:hypothetical protein